jgi:phosphohistidine phosphatase
VKRIAVLRHAKSSWDDPALDDFDRPLNDRGWKAARRIGRELRNRGLGLDLVLASTATRVRETLEGLQEKFELSAPIQFEQRIYLASEATLLALIRDLPDETESVLLVGHNPGLQSLLVDLTRNDADGLRARIGVTYPTAALAVVELPVSSWTAVDRASGRIVDLILPKALD